MATKIKSANRNYEYALALLSLFAVIFYTLCSTPTIGWRDGPELVVTSTYLDVAHPGGFPTYNLLAKILTWLPFGSLGFRVTLFSALATGLAVFLLGILLRKIHNLDKNNPPSLIWLFAGLPWFVLYQGIWAASVEVEVYSLNMLFILILLYCSTCWYEGKGIIYLYFGGFIYGLACGNHGSLALYLPVLLLLTFLGQPKTGLFLGLKHQSHIRLLILSVVFLIGLSVYLLLIVRSRTDSLPLDFGRTNNLSNFWYHITDGKDRSIHFKALFNFDNFNYYIKQQLKNITSPLIWLLIPFIIWGIKYLWVRYQILSVSLVLLMVINLGFFFYWIDGISAFLPSVTVGFLLAFLGLGQFGRLLTRLKIPRPITVIASLLVVIVGLTFLGHKRFSEKDSEAGFFATEIFWSDLTKLPVESVSLFYHNWFTILALKHIYMIRPDVNLLYIPEFSGSPIANPPIPEKNPLAEFPRTSTGEYIKPTTENYLSYFIDVNLEHRKDVYVEYMNTPDLFHTTPDLNFKCMAKFEIGSDTAYRAYQEGKYHQYLNFINLYMLDLSKNTSPYLSRKAPVNIYYCLRPVISYAFYFGEYQLTETVMRTFIDSFINNDRSYLIPYDLKLNANMFIINNLSLQNRYSEAIEEMINFIKLDPSVPLSYYLLGLLYEKNNQIDKSFELIESALQKDQLNLIFIVKYSNLLAKYKQIKTAKEFLEKKSKFFASKNMPNSSIIIDYYASCLMNSPEDDSINLRNLSITDTYRAEVFE
ncbi:MAG: DUF2723 domain-containing protein [Streptococcaceae bacterium]|jgi:tetratricopeptide (TPR) repeat protein|nr:DUF2723 domain-containing protein [Streptococcaceae bacterium]